MQTTKEKAGVVILPTEEETEILINTYVNETHNNSKVLNRKETLKLLGNNTNEELFDRGYKFGQIYIVSYEKPKIGDWSFGMDGVFQYKGKVNIDSGRLPRKIIATNNTSFNKTQYTKEDLGGNKAVKFGLAEIPKEWIEHYVEQYSKGNVITEVLVEYEYKFIYEKGEVGLKYNEVKQLKVSKDNTIKIHPVKTKPNTEPITYFELKNLENYIKGCSMDKPLSELIEGSKEAVKRDGYVSFSDNDFVRLVVLKLEKVEPEKMKASVMLKEIGLLNTYGKQPKNFLLEVFNYCVEVILFL